MLKIQTRKKTILNRRDFLSRTTAVGGMVILSATAGPAQALVTADKCSQHSPYAGKKIGLGNASVTDFIDLIGQKFRLRTESGRIAHAKLIEANSPKTHRGLRFRRNQFSIIFDVPVGLELVQGQFHLSHPRVGSMALFMVPVDLPGKQNRLEAVFA